MALGIIPGESDLVAKASIDPKIKLDKEKVA
jgi:hypothetical protein